MICSFTSSRLSRLLLTNWINGEIMLVGFIYKVAGVRWQEKIIVDKCHILPMGYDSVFC